MKSKELYNCIQNTNESKIYDVEQKKPDKKYDSLSVKFKNVPIYVVLEFYAHMVKL